MRSAAATRFHKRFDRKRPLGSKHRSQAAGGKPKQLPKSVVISTKAGSISPAAERSLKARGRHLLMQPLLTPEPLRFSLDPAGEYAAVLASSAQAIDIYAAAGAATDRPVYVVGSQAAAAAERAGFSDIVVAADARALAGKIRLSLKPEAGKILYIAGRHRARDMLRMLGEYEVELVELYAAKPATALNPSTLRAFKNGRVQQFTILSVRAADAFATAARKHGILRQARAAEAVCLSPRIAARMMAHGWRRTWAAPAPQMRIAEAYIIGGQADPPLLAAQGEAQSPPASQGQDNQSMPAHGNEAASSSDPALAANAAAAEPAPIAPRPSPAPPGSQKPEQSMDRTVSNSYAPPAGTKSPGWPAFIGLAVLAAIGGYLLWQSGQNQAESLRGQIASLEEQIADVGSDPGEEQRQAIAALADKNAADLASNGERLSGLEASVAGIPATTERLEAATAGNAAAVESADGAITELKTQVDLLTNGRAEDQQTLTAAIEALTAEQNKLSDQGQALAERTDAAAASLDDTKGAIAAIGEAIATSDETIAETGSRMDAVEAKMAAIEEWSKGANPASIANALVALADLRILFERGLPFDAALARASAATGEDSPAEDWAVKYASVGIPNEPMLASALRVIAGELPAPKVDASGNAIVDSVIGAFLSGVEISGVFESSDEPVRDAVKQAVGKLDNGDFEGADALLAPVAEQVPAIGEWRASYSARQSADAAIAAWQDNVLAKVGEGIQ